MAFCVCCSVPVIFFNVALRPKSKDTIFFNQDDLSNEKYLKEVFKIFH